MATSSPVSTSKTGAQADPGCAVIAAIGRDLGHRGKIIHPADELERNSLGEKYHTLPSSSAYAPLHLSS
jgi:hypothetical protein